MDVEARADRFCVVTTQVMEHSCGFCKSQRSTGGGGTKNAVAELQQRHEWCGVSCVPGTCDRFVFCVSFLLFSAGRPKLTFTKRSSSNDHIQEEHDVSQQAVSVACTGPEMQNMKEEAKKNNVEIPASQWMSHGLSTVSGNPKRSRVGPSAACV